MYLTTTPFKSSTPKWWYSSFELPPWLPSVLFVDGSRNNGFTACIQGLIFPDIRLTKRWLGYHLDHTVIDPSRAS